MFSSRGRIFTTARNRHCGTLSTTTTRATGCKNPYLDEDIQPLALTEPEIDDLIAFMASLTSSQYREQGIAELARQREIARTSRPQRDTARAFGPKPPRPAPPGP